jgi:hypothetical protein
MDNGIGSLSPSTNEKLEVSLAAKSTDFEGNFGFLRRRREFYRGERRFFRNYQGGV